MQTQTGDILAANSDFLTLGYHWHMRKLIILPSPHRLAHMLPLLKENMTAADPRTSPCRPNGPNERRRCASVKIFAITLIKSNFSVISFMQLKLFKMEISLTGLS